MLGTVVGTRWGDITVGDNTLLLGVAAVFTTPYLGERTGD